MYKNINIKGNSLNRKVLENLVFWLRQPGRKPLVLRGVRQSGKTWLIRELARQRQLQLIEINFETQPGLRSLFLTNDIKALWPRLMTLLPAPAERQHCLLFLDEIQVMPEMIAKLRWFYESLPDLAVIAAGSLLDFVLEEHTFSMPVGRIQFFYLDPLSFSEFLEAQNLKTLLDYLKNLSIHDVIPEAIHETLIKQIDNYCLVGGMPEGVKHWVDHQDYFLVDQIHHDLITAYQNDFAKYPTRIAPERLREVLYTIPALLGKKFTYKQVNPDIKSQSIANALSLLELARVVHRVKAVAADGLPLAAKIKHRYFKIILCDVGLINVLLHHPIGDLRTLTLRNNGEIAEQLVGQGLRQLFQFYQDPALYYWLREGGQSNAEIDYIIQHRDKIIPVEVKAGSVGGLRSLHYFMHMRQYTLAVRIYTGIFCITSVETKLNTGESVSYRLLSIPFYLLEELPRLLDECIAL